MHETPAKLLLIEDDIGKRYSIARQLRAARYEVWEAGTGLEGLELARNQPDIVILDVRLPDIDGFEVCRRLRADPLTASALVLELSARYATGADRVRGLEGGADAYLVHPVEANELLATVRALLRLREAERERLRLSVQAEASERRYRTVTETASVGLLLLDARGHCTYMNRAAEVIVGRSAASVQGQVLHEAIHAQHPDDSPYPREACPIYRAAVSGGEVHRHRDMVTRPDGSVVHVEMSACPIPNGNGASGAVVEVKDVTEVVRAELQRELFLGALGHDLRNPLQTISVGVQLLSRDESLSDKQREVLVRMVNSSDRMQRLIEQMLLVSRSSVRGVPIDAKPMNLAELCAAVVREAVLRHPDREVTVIDDLRTSIVADAGLLAQVVDNLVGNAIRHGRGRVEIHLERDGEDVLLSVHNHGEPIPEASLPTLFDPFRRAGGGLGGVGLGLYIVHELVRAHGGSVGVSSSAEQGTIFCARWPMKPRA